jgi:hypothetical protein
MNRSGSSQAAAAVGSGSYEERNRSSRRQQKIAITNHIRSNSSGPARIRHKQSEARPSQQVRTGQPRTTLEYSTTQSKAGE